MKQFHAWLKSWRSSRAIAIVWCIPITFNLMAGKWETTWLMLMLAATMAVLAHEERKNQEPKE